MTPLQKQVQIGIRVTSVLKQRCEAAADAAGLTLSDWIRAVLAQAASQGAFAPPRRGRRQRTKPQP